MNPRPEPDTAPAPDGAPLRIVFAGTPAFAAQALDALLCSRHEVVAVLSQPDRPAGRGQKLLASAVKQRALSANITVFQPEVLRVRAAGEDENPEQKARRERRNHQAEETLQALQALRPDVMVVAAYGLLLPQQVLDLPRWGCLNIHASLLPRWRGAAPIQRAIEAGDQETGICIMKMEAGLDTGPVGSRHCLPILPADTAGTLHDRLAELGASAIVQALDALADGVLSFVPQAADGVTYASKIGKHETVIDWHWSAQRISRHVRAFDPPGATTSLSGQFPTQTSLRVFQPRVLRESGHDGAEPGTVLAAGPQGLDVSCGGNGIVRFGEMQRAGGRRQPAEAFLRGHPLPPGTRFTRI